MLIGIFSLLLMGAVAYAYWREGPLTAFAMCCNTVLSGVIAFNFWEPIAGALEPNLAGTPLDSTEDALALMALFVGSLALFRFLTNTLASTHMEYPSVLYRGGAVFFGLLTGYFASGFLACVLQTLPWDREFLSFKPFAPGESTGMRKFLPGDVVWLASMYRLSGGALGSGSSRFDENATFEQRYLRYRRINTEGKTEDVRHGMKP